MTFKERLVQYREAKTLLVTMIEHLTSIRASLSQYNQSLSATPSRETLANMGVTLTFEGTNLNNESWTAERIAEAHRAVMAIIDRIAAASEVERLFALLLFSEVFGGVEIQLVEGSNSNDGEAYASTADVTAGGNTIYLYTQPTAYLPSDLNRCSGITVDDPDYNNCVIHSTRNIVHEFGHVLVNRYGGSQSLIYQDWEKIWQEISDFDTDLGWVDGRSSLQNQSALQDLIENGGDISRLELENERVANMFEAWVFGRQPDLDTSNIRQLRAAWAMWALMTGNCPPDEVNVSLRPDYELPCGHGRGFIYRLFELGGQSDELDN